MLKRIFILVAACLLCYMSVSAQDTTPDCSAAKLSTALAGAYQKAQADLLAGVEPQTVLNNLQSKLSAIQAVCGDATAASPESATPGLDDYSDIPQSRLADGGFVLGNPDARVTIVEFLDYACPHCQNYQPTIRDFIRDYVRTGQAKFEARILPTRGGAVTEFVGNVVACLEDQQTGAFWAAQEILYELAIAEKFDEKTPSVIAERLGLDYGQALQCSIDHPQVQTDVALANEFGAGSTPTIMVRYAGGDPKFITYQGTTYSGGGPPIEAIEAAINSTDGSNM
ncbi:MAG: thioredoxin domain-containing protein [Chloroflexota bacterium]